MTKQKLQLYYVEGGDTLYKIAKRFNTTEQAIISFNSPWLSRFSPGLKLWVPDNRIGLRTSSVDDIEYFREETEDEAESRAAAPDIVNLDISPRKIAFMGSTIPGYLTISLKTSMPTKGDITVSGNSQTTKIVLSASEYKTDHLVYWSPINDQTKQPLPPGQYSLSLNLYKQNGETALGLPQGDVIVVHEPSPLAAIDRIKVEPVVISPKLNSTAPLLTISFRVNRPVEATLVLQGHSYNKHSFPKMTYMPGIHSITWDGRSSGSLMPDGEYRTYFTGKDLTLSDNPSFFIYGESFRIRGSEAGIPKSRIREVVQGISIGQTAITPEDTGSKNVLTGTITLKEKARISLYVTNAIGYNVAPLIFQQELEAGAHPFAWNGRGFMGEKLPNGTYSFSLTLFEQGKYGYLDFPDVKFNIVGSKAITPAYPVQNVQITVRYIDVELATGGAYLALKGSIYPIINYFPSYGGTGYYSILLAEGVEGFVKVGAVEWLGLDKLPQKNGKIITAGAAVMTGPDYEAVVLEYLPVNTIVRLLNKEGEWYRIALSSGRQGYVRAAELQEVTSPTPEEPIPPKGTVHTVVVGDTLWKIAQKYGVAINDIVEANNLNPNSYLAIGQKLNIPSKTPATPLIYYIQSGDTLWKIAQTYGVTVNDIAVVNRLDLNNPIWVNQKIIIPKVYRVAAGDTLWRIAQKHNTSIQKLVQLNGMDVNKPLLIGQNLLIGL